MVRSLTLVFLFWSYASFGQLTDSIVIRYDKGYYSFGSPGKYSMTEIIKLAKAGNTDFHLQSHLQLKKSFDSINDKIIIDTIPVNVQKKVISKNEINRLLHELNNSHDNFNEAFVKPYLKPPSRKEVLNVTKKYDLHWRWEEADREDRKTALQELKEFKYLDSFLLKRKPSMEFDMVMIDVWNGYSLTVFQGDNLVEYRGQFYELFGQPVKRFDNKDYGNSKRVINLEINNAIKKILPANSILKKVIDLDNVNEEYIKWYFEQIM